MFGDFAEITVIGNVTAEPELRYINRPNQEPRAVLNLNLAVSTPVSRDAQNTLITETRYYKSVLWGAAAEQVANMAFKGARVMVRDAQVEVKFWSNKDDRSKVALKDGKPLYDLELVRAASVVVLNPRSRPADEEWGVAIG